MRLLCRAFGFRLCLYCFGPVGYPMKLPGKGFGFRVWGKGLGVTPFARHALQPQDATGEQIMTGCRTEKTSLHEPGELAVLRQLTQFSS